MTITNIEVDSIINHGSVIQILGRDTVTGVMRSIVGDWRMMDAAIEGLGIQPGETVGVFVNDDGVDCLCEPENELEARVATLGGVH